MATLQTINVGSYNNDPSADTIRVSFQKTVANDVAINNDLTTETAARIAADALKANSADLTTETAARIAADAVLNAAITSTKSFAIAMAFSH